MASAIPFSRKDALLLAGFFAVLIPALNVLPYQFEVPGDVYSVASYVGYNSKAAYFAAVTVCALCFLAFFLSGSRTNDSMPGAVNSARALPLSSRLIEIVFVVAGVFLLYCPIFLARYGPYIEDNYYLTLLHRMHGGQRPYVDFEYLYGPLLLYPQHWWLNLFGYSMKAYYMFQALMEAAAFSVLLWMVQGYFPEWRKRWIVFALLGVLIFNTVLAQNYNGLRRLVPVIALLWLSTQFESWKKVAAASVLLGIWLAFSHELAFAALAAASALYAVLWYRERDAGLFLKAGMMWILALGTWYLVIVAVLGPAQDSYFQATAFVLSRFSAGEQAFPFRWSLNSLVLFLLLLSGCALVGRGLRSGSALFAGDRMMIVAVVYALLALRAGLNRSDIWHLVPPVFPLIFAFVLPLQKRAFAFSKKAQHLVSVAIITLAVTYLISLAPFGSFYAGGLLNGLRDAFGHRGMAKKSVRMRAPSIEWERSRPDEDVLKLGAYLAAPELENRTVVFYSRLWAIDKRVGVYSRAYLPDDFFMTDMAGHAISELITREKAIVILHEIVYRHLFLKEDSPEYARYLDRQPMTTTKQIIVWLATPFFRDLPVEWALKEERWERTVAPTLRSYQKTAQFGSFVVLMSR